MSIHNLSYQGRFPKELLPLLGIGWERFNHLELEFWDTINFLKAGLVYSDAIVAVSPTYAQEIRTHEHGWWLEGVLSERQDRLYGIINGIDTEVFDPARDSDIKAVYSAKSPKKRAPNKTALREELNLPQWETPLIGMVSRFVSQKGLDILLEMGDRIPHLGVQWALLGTGEAYYEVALKGLAAKYPEHVSVSIGFSDALARRIYSGSDFFFMPSLFEPCGLGQMIALRYGSLPIVRRTGGLSDTVPDIGLPDGVGIVFDHPTADDASHAVWRAKELWQNKKFMEKVVKRGMEKDFSWTGSARQYKELYEKLQNEQGKSPMA
jgi:starch synthase